MNYRKAEISDIPQLIQMRVAYLKEDYGNLEDYVIEKIESSLPDYFNRHLNNDLSAFIAEENNLIIATTLLLVVEKPANPSFITGKTGSVLNVFTRQEYRRKGIAKVLMQMLIKEAEEKELDFIELKATNDGRHLYKQMGFQEEKSSKTDMKLNLQELIMFKG